MEDKVIVLCKKIYEVIGPKGFYPGLTGGQLYKEGARKDIDIIIYRNRQEKTFELEDIEILLKECGFTEMKHFGFITKAKWKGLNVDIFNPESIDNACIY